MTTKPRAEKGRTVYIRARVTQPKYGKMHLRVEPIDERGKPVEILCDVKSTDGKATHVWVPRELIVVPPVKEDKP